MNISGATLNKALGFAYAALSKPYQSHIARQLGKPSASHQEDSEVKLSYRWWSARMSRLNATFYTLVSDSPMTPVRAQKHRVLIDKRFNISVTTLP